LEEDAGEENDEEQEASYSANGHSKMERSRETNQIEL
jgi:hypothetical protein